MKRVRYVTKTVQKHNAGFPSDDATACVAWFARVLNDIPEPYRAGATIDISSTSGYDESHYAEITVSYTRPETDEEEAEREAKEHADADRKRAAELNQLAALQAKYGKQEAE